MKSIKEKAEDYVSGFHPSIQRMCKESFEAGANYVLDAIEELLTKDSSPVIKKSVIKAFIEQLKSNQ